MPSGYLVDAAARANAPRSEAHEQAPLKLPAGRTEAEALRVAKVYADRLYGKERGGRTEDQIIDALREICTSLCEGDRKSGRRLATMAIWGG